MWQAQWPLQTAEAQLSALVEATLRREPQRITRRGKDAVMVLSEKTGGRVCIIMKMAD